MVTVIIDTCDGTIVKQGAVEELHKAMTLLLAVHGQNDLSGINRFELVSGESVEQILSVFN